MYFRAANTLKSEKSLRVIHPCYSHAETFPFFEIDAPASIHEKFFNTPIFMSVQMHIDGGLRLLSSIGETNLGVDLQFISNAAVTPYLVSPDRDCSRPASAFGEVRVTIKRQVSGP